MARTIIRAEGVSVEFSGFRALNKVDFSMETGELRFLIGPNGAGKTTLLDVICGKVKPTEGRVIFGNNVDMNKFSDYEIVRHGVSRKFQAPSVFENLSVMDNMGLSMKGGRGLLASFVRSDSSAIDRIHQILRTVELDKRVFSKAGDLSHGEKQWLEIAMTISQEPALLLVDEPVAGMTGRERNRTGEILMETARERSVLVVEHDMNFVKRFAQKVTVLHEGSLLCEGTFAEVSSDPTVIDVYLGRGGEAQENGH
jgi:urea transport system ATP-binding protein